MALKHDGRKPFRVEPGVWKFPASHDCKAWWDAYDHHPDGSTLSFCTCPSYQLGHRNPCKHIEEMWRLEREAAGDEPTEQTKPRPHFLQNVKRLGRVSGDGEVSELERIYNGMR